MNWLGSLISGISGGIGNISNALGSALLNGIKGGLSKLAGLFVSAFNFAVSMVGKTLAGIGRIGGEALGALSQAARSLAKGGMYLLAGAVAGVAVSAQKAVVATLAWSRSIGDLRATTGLSTRGASATQSRFASVGLDASQMFRGENAALFGLKTSAYGIRGGYDSPDFLPQAAERFQSLNQQGLTGQMLAQSLARSLKMDSPEAMRVLNTPSTELRSQQEFSSRAQAAFDLDPTKIATASRQFGQLTQRVQVLGQTVLLAIGQRILPTLTRWADGALRIVEHFSSQGSDLLNKGIDLMVSGIGRAFEALVILGRFFYADAPAMAFKFVDSMIGGLQTIAAAAPSMFEVMLQSIDLVQQIAGPAFDWLAQAILRGVDVIQANAIPAFDWLSQTVPVLFDLLVRGVSAATAAIDELVRRAPEIWQALVAVFDNIANHPLVKGVLKTIQGVSTLTGAAARAGDAAERVVTGNDETSGVGWLAGGAAVWAALKALPGLLSGGGFWSGLGKVLTSDLALVPTLGAAAGTAVYEGVVSPVQRQFDELAPSGAGEAWRNTLTRLANVVTGRDYNLNISQADGAATQQAGVRAAQVAAQDGTRAPAMPPVVPRGSQVVVAPAPQVTVNPAQPQMPQVVVNQAAQVPPRVIVNQVPQVNNSTPQSPPVRAPGEDPGAFLRRSMAAIVNAGRTAFNGTGEPRTSTSANSPTRNLLSDGLQGLLDQAPRGTWSRGMDAKVGGGLRAGASRAEEELEKLRTNFREKFSGYQDAEGRSKAFDEMVELLRGIAGASEGTERNTGRANSQPMFTDSQARELWQMTQNMMRAKAGMDFVRLTQK